MLKPWRTTRTPIGSTSLRSPALAEVQREGDDYSALARGYRAGAVVMLGVALDKTDAESLPP